MKASSAAADASPSARTVSAFERAAVDRETGSIAVEPVFFVPEIAQAILPAVFSYG
jgi:hypothetical protein